MEEKRCLHCNNVLTIKEGIPPYELKRKKFCSRSCAASFNNKRREMPKVIHLCINCGEKVSRSSDLCVDCYRDSVSTANKSLGFYTKDKTYLSSKCQQIRYHSRKVMADSGIERVCSYCKDHTYDSILQVHHIKSILQFDHDTLVEEINDTSNLVWLCPNHHAMLEQGLISL